MHVLICCIAVRFVTTQTHTNLIPHLSSPRCCADTSDSIDDDDVKALTSGLEGGHDETPGKNDQDEIGFVRFMGGMVLRHVFGSWLPKSLDVSSTLEEKMSLDQRLGAEA